MKQNLRFMANSYPRIGGHARRLIDLRRHDARTVVGWLEDDFHHFGVTIVHESGLIVDVRTAAVRFPFSACPGAADPLRKLIGAPVIARASDVGTLVEMRQQCTHLFDLAGLALAHVAAGREHRRYHATVTDRPIVAWEEGRRRLLGAGRAELYCDAVLVLAWDVDRREITGPDAWAGQSLERSFRERTETMEVEPAEYATVLRRAVMVAGGRTLDPDLYANAGMRGRSGSCYTFQEERRNIAQRMYGSTLNYEQSSEGMLARVNDVP
jgi:hypothetical protein